MAKPKREELYYPYSLIIKKRNRRNEQERQERKQHRGKGKVKEEDSAQESAQGDSADL